MLSKVTAILRQAPAYVRSRLTSVLAVLLVFCVPLSLFAWYFDVTEDLSARITLTVIAASVLVWSFFPDKQRMTPRTPPKIRTAWGQTILVALTMWTGCLIAAGDKFDLWLLTSHSTMVFMSLIWFAFAWALMKGNMLLLTSLVLAVLIMMVFWVVALHQHEGPQELLFLPLLLVAFVGTVWVPFARWTLGVAWRQKNRRIYGPGSQALAMFVLFLPTTFVAVALPIGLQLDETWTAVSLVMVGVVLSAVVGEPLRRFLVDWARLRPFGE